MPQSRKIERSHRGVICALRPGHSATLTLGWVPRLAKAPFQTCELTSKGIHLLLHIAAMGEEAPQKFDGFYVPDQVQLADM